MKRFIFVIALIVSLMTAYYAGAEQRSLAVSYYPF